MSSKEPYYTVTDGLHSKTLICLAVILATKDHISRIPPQYPETLRAPIRPKVGSLIDMCASTIGRYSVPWQSWFDEYRSRGDDYQRCVSAIERYPGHYFKPPPILRRTR